MNLRNDNQFESPLANERTRHKQKTVSISNADKAWRILKSAMVNLFFGVALNLMLFISCYPIVVGLLDLLFTPPLEGVDSYGQFGFLVVLFGAFGIAGGILAVFIPVIGIWLYICLYLLAMQTLYISVYGRAMNEYFRCENFGYLVCCLFFVGLMAVAHKLYGGIKEKEQER